MIMLSAQGCEPPCVRMHACSMLSDSVTEYSGCACWNASQFKCSVVTDVMWAMCPLCLTLAVAAKYTH